MAPVTTWPVTNKTKKAPGPICGIKNAEPKIINPLTIPDRYIHQETSLNRETSAIRLPASHATTTAVIRPNAKKATLAKNGDSTTRAVRLFNGRYNPKAIPSTNAAKCANSCKTGPLTIGSRARVGAIIIRSSRPSCQGGPEPAPSASGFDVVSASGARECAWAGSRHVTVSLRDVGLASDTLFPSGVLCPASSCGGAGRYPLESGILKLPLLQIPCRDTRRISLGKWLPLV